jgi:hypothetical protein
MAESAGPSAGFVRDRLLSRPDLPDEAEPYWSAFLDLDRDRRRNKIGGGMVGSVDLPDCISLDRIRAEGARQGYEGDGLEDFVAVLRGIDDEFVRVNSLRIAAEFKSAVSRSRDKQ